MTKEDYLLLAQAISDVQPKGISGKISDQEKQWRSLITILRAKLQADNPNFDPDRFTLACYGRKEPY